MKEIRNAIGIVSLILMFLAIVAVLFVAHVANEFTVIGALLLMLIPAMLIFKTIPTYYIGQVTRFEKRVTGVIGEGIIAIIPFIEEINIIFNGQKRMVMGEAPELFVAPVKATEYTTKTLSKKGPGGKDIVQEGKVYYEVILEAFFKTTDPDKALGVGGGDQALNETVEHQIKSRVRTFMQEKEDYRVINLKDELGKTVLVELTTSTKTEGEDERKALELAGQTISNIVVRIIQKPKSLRDADEDAVKQVAQMPAEQADAASLREEAQALMASKDDGGLGIEDPQFAALVALSRKGTPGVILVYGGDEKVRQAAVWNQTKPGNQGPPPV